MAVLSVFQTGCPGQQQAPAQTAAGPQGGAAAPATTNQAAANNALGGTQMFSALPQATTGASGASGASGATGAAAPGTTGTQVAATTGASGASGAAGTSGAAAPSGTTASGTSGTAPPAGSSSFALNTSPAPAVVPTSATPAPAATQTPSGGGSSTPSQPANQLASASKPSQPSGGLGSPSEKTGPPPQPNPLGERGSGPGCFTAGTLVMTARGLVPIESLVAGESVLAPAKEELRTQASAAGSEAPVVEPARPHVIVRTTRLPNDHLRVLTLTDASGIRSRIETTEGHPFWVEGKGWKRAMDLAAGDLLSRGDAGYATVEATVLEEHPEGVWVYNLEVEDTRTYQVGPLGIVVQGW